MDAVDLTNTPDEGDLLRTPAVDAALPASEWQSVLALRRGGVTDAGLYRLLRLRTAYRHHTHPAADGLEADSRAQFARWLVAEGHAIEDATLALTTPLMRKHLNPFGRYHFDLDRLRQPLR
jgi:hypothetical protein